MECDNMKQLIPRNQYLEKILPYKDTPLIKVITGIRRSGKSEILSLLEDELILRGVTKPQIIRINFENMDYSEITTTKAFHQYIVDKMNESDSDGIPKRYYLLLDEIQEVDGWEKAINSLLASNRADIYITGSNSRLLSSELATYIAGRYVEIQIQTLSFAEYLDFVKHRINGSYRANNSNDSDGGDSDGGDNCGNSNGGNSNGDNGNDGNCNNSNDIKHTLDTHTLDIHKAFTKYIRMGGFPIIHTAYYTNEEMEKIVYDIYSSILLRDTIQRYGIRNIDLLERIVKYVFDNIGNTFSAKNVADFFKSQHRKVDLNTVYHYLSALSSAFVILKVPRYDLCGKEILATMEKFYVGDVSLIYALMGYKDKIIGGVLENIVVQEIMRRGYRVFVGKSGVREIDFIGEKQNQKIYVQVCYHINSEETAKREFSSLSMIKDNYPKYVVSMDDVWQDNRDGIHNVHIADFLLMDKW